MKAVRIVQVLLVVLAAVYLWLFHTANPDLVRLPLTSYLLPPIPVAYVVGLALVIGLLVGYLPPRLTAWRRGRELAKARREVAQLQAQLRDSESVAKRTGTYYPVPEVPVIPDRGIESAFDADQDENSHA